MLAGVEGRLTLFAVDAHADGVHVGVPDKKLGNRGQLTADVVLDGVHVPAADRVGEEGQGLRIALATLTYGRVGIAASGVGMAQAAFDRTVAHLRERAAFGKRLAEFQHWQFRMAEHATRLESARNLVAKAARLMDEGVAFPEPEASMAKASATERPSTSRATRSRRWAATASCARSPPTALPSASRRSTATRRSPRSTRARTRSSG